MLDALALGTGVLDTRRAKWEAPKRAARLQRAVFNRSERIADTQAKADRARASVNGAFSSLDAVLNLGRTPGGDGLEDAEFRWAEASRNMDEARRAMVRLPELSNQIIGLCELQRRDLAVLMGSADSEQQDEYFRRLDGAHQLLIDTTRLYEEMTELLRTGMKHYEVLFGITDRLLKENRAGTFRSARDAAQVYTIRTERLIPDIRAFKTQVGFLQERADLKADETTAAFRRAKQAEALLR